ncbi:hypothetical protein [Vulcanisaeta distributa]|uniref:hypothetical protein n=1 Tax=Vulcanisaeta distributa TaxID=164451 RepID=UPI0006D0AA77|nr:hypothetical protein [Vulcanisaeta distributa]
MSNMPRCRILLITRSVLTEGGFYEALSEALGGVGDVDLEVIYLESYEVNEVSRQLKAVRRPDIALLSLMGDHPELLNYLRNWLRETPIVFTLSTGLETIMLTKVRNYELGGFLINSVSTYNDTIKTTNYFDPKTLSHVLHEASKALSDPISHYVKDWALLIDYWRNWRKENIVNMIRLVLRNYCGIAVPAPEPPIELGDYWIEDYEGGYVYYSADELLKQRDLKSPLIVLMAYSGQSYDKAKKVITHIMKRRVDTISLLSNYGYTLRGGLRSCLIMLMWGGILDLQWFRFVRNREDEGVLLKFNVPVMNRWSCTAGT